MTFKSRFGKINKVICGVLALIIVMIVSAVRAYGQDNWPRISSPPGSQYVAANTRRPVEPMRTRGQSKEPPAAIAPLTAAEAKRIQAESARALGIPVEKEISLGGGVTMKFVWIPPGEFMMGSRDSSEQVVQKAGLLFLWGLFDGEHPQHRVRISKGFYMCVYEVTQAQYRAVMGTNPSNFKGDNLPVENVSWSDATAFLQKVSDKTGKAFRLPTEAQWEYAARAGTTTPFYFGETISTQQANYDGDWPYGNDSKGIDREKTIDVGSFAANAFGLCDMHGNVYEWCSDWHDDKYYASRPNPDVDPTGPKIGKWRVLRGGSWGAMTPLSPGPASCRSAYRAWFPPSLALPIAGFRVVTDLE
jgi:formylglycine-generating enzyme required for sulfatase activity